MKRPNLSRSRTLRRNQTDAERKLWSVLRNRQLEGMKFRRQFPLDDFILDFYSPEYKLAIESDGGQHYSDEELTKDRTRSRALGTYGIRILRFSNRDILMNIEGVCEIILRTVAQPAKPPSPQSSPRGERR
ncbi:MAG TPA: endonuclease domain-containing protein [Nitrospirota bacterium]|nr:endonuclease domain-containing protein [Nitrospirota bacterium]